MSPNGSSQEQGDEARPGSQPAGASDGTSATPGPVGVEAAPSRAELPDDQDELRRQIEQTRSELGDTVEALSAKADVKAQVKEKVDERKDQLHDQQEQAKVKLDEVQEQAKVRFGELQEQAKEVNFDELVQQAMELDFDELQQQAKVKFGELQQQAKENPAPFVAGVVVLVLLMRRRRRRRRS